LTMCERSRSFNVRRSRRCLYRNRGGLTREVDITTAVERRRETSRRARNSVCQGGRQLTVIVPTLSKGLGLSSTPEASDDERPPLWLGMERRAPRISSLATGNDGRSALGRLRHSLRTAQTKGGQAKDWREECMLAPRKSRG